MSEAPLTRVMFVCMGNICRSPLAEGVFRHVAQEMNVFDHYEVASSGYGGLACGAKTGSANERDGERGTGFPWKSSEHSSLSLAIYPIMM